MQLGGMTRCHWGSVCLKLVVLIDFKVPLRAHYKAIRFPATTYFRAPRKTLPPEPKSMAGLWLGSLLFFVLSDGYNNVAGSSARVIGSDPRTTSLGSSRCVTFANGGVSWRKSHLTSQSESFPPRTFIPLWSSWGLNGLWRKHEVNILLSVLDFHKQVSRSLFSLPVLVPLNDDISWIWIWWSSRPMGTVLASLTFPHISCYYTSHRDHRPVSGLFEFRIRLWTAWI